MGAGENKIRNKGTGPGAGGYVTVSGRQKACGPQVEEHRTEAPEAPGRELRPPPCRGTRLRVPS